MGKMGSWCKPQIVLSYTWYTPFYNIAQVLLVHCHKTFASSLKHRFASEFNKNLSLITYFLLINLYAQTILNDDMNACLIHWAYIKIIWIFKSVNLICETHTI